MYHGVFWPDEHAEELAGQLEGGHAHQPRRLLAHPDKEVAVAVQDVHVLRVQVLLLQLVPGDINLNVG